MSSSRSVAAARARRANGNNSSTPLRAGQLQQPQQQSRQQYNRQTSAQPPVVEAPRKNPYDAKLSVSDAFALVTIRLGRVETILQKMDVSSIINKMEAGETTSEEAGTNVMLKGLLSRIEDIENNVNTDGGGGMTDDDRETINDLSTRLDSAKSEINDLKSTIFKMQTMIIDISQKVLPSLANTTPRVVSVSSKKTKNASVNPEENVLQVKDKESSDEEIANVVKEDITESSDEQSEDVAVINNTLEKEKDDDDEDEASVSQ